jgi:hypothetical protein
MAPASPIQVTRASSVNASQPETQMVTAGVIGTPASARPRSSQSASIARMLRCRPLKSPS